MLLYLQTQHTFLFIFFTFAEHSAEHHGPNQHSKNNQANRCQGNIQKLDWLIIEFFFKRTEFKSIDLKPKLKFSLSFVLLQSWNNYKAHFSCDLVRRSNSYFLILLHKLGWITTRISHEQVSFHIVQNLKPNRQDGPSPVNSICDTYLVLACVASKIRRCNSSIDNRGRKITFLRPTDALLIFFHTWLKSQIEDFFRNSHAFSWVVNLGAKCFWNALGGGLWCWTAVTLEVPQWLVVWWSTELI